MQGRQINGSRHKAYFLDLHSKGSLLCLVYRGFHDLASVAADMQMEMAEQVVVVLFLRLVQDQSDDVARAELVW